MSRKKYKEKKLAKVLIAKSKKTGDKIVFRHIKKGVKKKPSLVLALAVGRTTDGLHELINQDAKKNPTHWKKIKILQIDEIVGAKSTSPVSFNFEFRSELKNLFNIVENKNSFLIDGTQNLKETIRSLKRFIKKNNGIDIITLGLGPHYDPHVAYNTKGRASFNSSVHVVKLHPKTVKNIKKRVKEKTSKSFTKGITLGIKDILSARKAILIAYGKPKSKSIDLAFNKKINVKNTPASALQLHKNLYIVTDKLAGKCLVK